jgi:UDP-2,4-diacetamido-2,4,6-trideoxy-beta-L-altropyranose hydrolase
MTTLLIRADGSPQIGLGHVMRCLALAQAWQDRGGTACFVRAGTADVFDERLAAEGVGLRRIGCVTGSAEDADAARALARELNAAAVVLDGYHFNTAFQARLRGDAVKLLCVDDNAHAGEYVADWVLNQNLHAEPALYARRAPHTRLLLGTQLALLRREFTRWRDWPRETPARIRRLLVTLGGSDPDNVTGTVIAALERLSLSDLEVVVVVGGASLHYETLRASLRLPGASLRRNVSDMPELMRWADLAVTAGGSTCWEAACLGLPLCSLVIVENQLASARRLASTGAAEVIEPGGAGWDTDKLAGVLNDLAHNSARRAQMTTVGRALVDGRGAERVAAIMAGKELNL